MTDKKILDTSPVSGIAVPIAIVLVGALIIWGVTQMLSSGRSHRDLVDELHSKTFGNRWVAAYELSKYIASSSIPEKDIPWTVENLAQVYTKASNDSKTRNFVVMAMGGLKSSLSFPYLIKAVSDPDREVSFNAIVALGKMAPKGEVDWSPVGEKLKSEDSGIAQVALITLAQHKIVKYESDMRELLRSELPILKYTAAQVLIPMSSNRPEAIINDMVELKESDPRFNSAQVESLKLNLIHALSQVKDSQAIAWLKRLSLDKNIKISTKAVQFLNLLKN